MIGCRRRSVELDVLTVQIHQQALMHGGSILNGSPKAMPVSRGAAVLKLESRPMITTPVAASFASFILVERTERPRGQVTDVDRRLSAEVPIDAPQCRGRSPAARSRAEPLGRVDPESVGQVGDFGDVECSGAGRGKARSKLDGRRGGVDRPRPDELDRVAPPTQAAVCATEQIRSPRSAPTIPRACPGSRARRRARRRRSRPMNGVETNLIGVPAR